MLYLGPYEKDHVISEFCYKGTILQILTIKCLVLY